MAKAYYGSKISENMTMMPEGFLVCRNVPIARTGTQQYLNEELGLEGTGIVTVHREPTEVFDQRTIASFEGKAFTDTHPSVDVTTDNWAIYSKGEVTNVRKGSGDSEGYLIADIIVRDPITINEIQSGAKREVSAGYECEYVSKNGTYFQTNIIGNHVALVQAGRAGKTVAIKDEKPEPKGWYKQLKTLDKAIKVIDEDKPRELTDKEKKKVEQLSKQVKAALKRHDYKEAGRYSREIEIIEFGNYKSIRNL